jgi:hypothetical protein
MAGRAERARARAIRVQTPRASADTPIVKRFALLALAVLIVATGCAGSTAASQKGKGDQAARQSRASAATDFVSGFAGTSWYDAMAGSRLDGDVMKVTTSIYPDEDGKVAGGMLCSQWNVGLNTEAGSWADDVILVEVTGQDTSPLAHLSPLSMRCT